MAKDEEYGAAIEKASQLLEILSSAHSTSTAHPKSSSVATPSKFTAVEDLSKYGYTDDLTSCKSGRRILKRLESALQALNINAEMAVDGGNNVLIEHQHLEDRTIDGVLYPATNAVFVQICNPADGVLIAYNNSTAEHSGRLQDPPVITIPPLHYWSDIAYLQWLSACATPKIKSVPAPETDILSLSDSDLTPTPIMRPAPIKYIFRLTIQNMPTISILNKIMTKHKYTTYDVWPGRTFSVDSEEGKAIIGTPNGAGVGWVLAQHKKELEDRKIDKVTVFYAENEGDICRWPSLCFWIV